MTKPTCVSLFTGCGGIDLGMERAGFRISFATDIEPLCRESYARNFGEVTPYSVDSITEINGEVVMGSAHELSPPDLLVGGPPCPPYSKSRFYLRDKPRGLEDPIGDLTLEGYIRILGDLRPRAFLFENVPGFAYKVHRQALDRLSMEARNLGYSTTWAVLNAADFGVPQIRKRFFMVGVADGSFVFPSPTHRDPGASQPELFNGALREWITAGEVLGDLDTEENADDTGHFAGGKFHDLLCEVPPGDNYLYFTEERGHPEPIFKWRSRYWSFLLKLSPAMPSWTIQARRSNNMGPFHWRNRILRIPEILRLQGFPDGFELAGTVEQQWRQVGNAVPPPLAQALGAAIMAHLREP